mgnify:FL=1
MQEESLKEEAPKEVENEVEDTIEETKEPKKSIFEKWGDKFRDFLDNAE